MFLFAFGASQHKILHQEDDHQAMPAPVKQLLSEAGVLNAFPEDASPRNNLSDSYFRTPGDGQSYDWDLTMDTLDDVTDVVADPQVCQ